MSSDLQPPVINILILTWILAIETDNVIIELMINKRKMSDKYKPLLV